MSEETSPMEGEGAPLEAWARETEDRLRRQNRVLVLLQWLRTYFTGNLSARLITGKSNATIRESPEAHWVAAEGARLHNNGPELLNSPSSSAVLPR